jgi:tetratricopeptide (TPR) repeat protein
MPIKNNIFIVILLLFFFSEVKAHGDLSARISDKTIEISKSPKNPALYFERGFLYQQHNEFKKAIKDYLKSERLGLDNKLLCFRKTEAYYKANKLNKALKEVELCLKYDSLDIKTYKLKSKILFKLKKYNDAILAYKYVIQNTKDLRPEDYINYSDLILAIDNKNYKTAIATLDLGIKKAGNNAIVFQLKKIEYLKKSNQNVKVISLYNALIQGNKRKEFLYYEKAKYLFELGDNENSNIALQQAKLAITELKLKYKNTVAIKKLQTNINALEIKLEL